MTCTLIKGLNVFKNNKGFSLIELMVVVAIIAILSMIAVPSYQGFTAKARQKEGFSLLNSYYTAAQATAAEISFFPGNFVATGFAPTGQLTYRLTAADNANDPTYGSNDNGCVNTMDGTACNCGGSCPNFKTWRERVADGAGIGPQAPAGGCAAATTNANFTVCASARIRNNGQVDTYRINELKNMQMTMDGLN